MALSVIYVRHTMCHTIISISIFIVPSHRKFPSSHRRADTVIPPSHHPMRTSSAETRQQPILSRRRRIVSLSACKQTTSLADLNEREPSEPWPSSLPLQLQLPLLQSMTFAPARFLNYPSCYN